MVLSNLPMESRGHYPSLVAALESRFGSKKQGELHRMKLRNRVRRRDETVETLSMAYYPLRDRKKKRAVDWRE